MYSPTKKLYQIGNTKTDRASPVYTLEDILRCIKSKRGITIKRPLKLYEEPVVFEFDSMKDLKSYFVEYLI